MLKKRQNQIISIGVLSFFSTFLSSTNDLLRDFDNSILDEYPNLTYFRQALWNDTWGDSYEQSFHDVKFDDEGNIYVTGYNYNPTNNHDFVKVKYNLNGQLLWNRTCLTMNFCCYYNHLNYWYCECRSYYHIQKI